MDKSMLHSHHLGYRPDVSLVDSDQSPTDDEGGGAHLSDHDHHLVDDNDHQLITMDENVVFRKLQGARMGRVYKKSNWSVDEMLVLQVANREDRDRVERGLNGSHQPAHERWNWIEDYCWTLGVQRSAQQCHDKWEGISTVFKKVYNIEKHVPSGQKSYWQMSTDERKKNKLAPNFQRQIFNALLEWYNSRSKIVDPGELVVDTSAPMCYTGANPDFSDSEEESDEEISSPSRSGKKRKLGVLGVLGVRNSEEGLAMILMRNNKRVVDAMMESENRKDKRHKEDIEMEKTKLELEKEKFRGAMKLASGYITALNSIGDGLKQLSAALIANVHS